MNALQRDYLLRPLDARRVRQDAKGFNHLEAWDIRRTLLRYFGFGGWSYTNDTQLVREIEHPAATTDGRSRWTVIYRTKLRLEIFDPHGNRLAFFEEYAAGDAANQKSLGDAHDQAIKTSESQALKRAATNLGDGLGLSLYDGGGRLLDNGTVQPVVQATLDVHGTAPNVRDEPVRGEQQQEAA
ncbi:Rad52/Rad22 family DNA repair protein [Streptomyces sp. NPDC002754]